MSPGARALSGWYSAPVDCSLLSGAVVGRPFPKGLRRGRGVRVPSRRVAHGCRTEQRAKQNDAPKLCRLQYFHGGDTMADPPRVRSIEVALDILECLARSEPAGLGLADVSQELRLPKSTVFRMVGTLELRGYVRRDPRSGRYRLGIRAMELGTAVLNHLELREVARPELEALVEETREIAHLAALDEGDVVYIDKVESPQPIRIYSRIGRRAPAYCTGVGKALLSGLDEAALQAYLDSHPLRRFTASTITDRSRLLEEIRAVRERGYALDMEEHEEGVRCVAVPLFDYTGQVVAAVSITAPAIRMGMERIQALIPRMLELGARISRALGYPGPSLAQRPARGGGAASDA